MPLALATSAADRMPPEGAALVCAHMLCSSARAEEELGYKAVPLRVMVEDCYRWMAEEGLLG